MSTPTGDMPPPQEYNLDFWKNLIGLDEPPLSPKRLRRIETGTPIKNLDPNNPWQATDSFDEDDDNGFDPSEQI